MKFLKHLVYDRERQRPTLIIRLGLYLLVFLILLVPGELLLADEGHESVWQEAQSLLLMAASALLAAWIFCRFVDRRAFAELGFGKALTWWRDCGIGCLIGGLCALLPFLLGLMLGWVEVFGTWKMANPRPGFWMQMIPELLFLMGVAITEETVFRGYLLTNLVESFRREGLRRVGTACAVLISSLLFGLSHIANTGAGTWGLMGISLAGLAWALWRVRSQSLAMPLGAHFAINLVYFNVLGGMGPGGDLGSHTTLFWTSWRTGGFVSTDLGLSWSMILYLSSQFLMLVLGLLWIRWTGSRRQRAE